MMEEEIEHLNHFFGRIRIETCLEKPFVHFGNLPNGIHAEGEIILEWKGELYPFRVQMPSNFPLNGLLFYFQGGGHARHLLRAGLVCVESFFTDCFAQKMEADLEAILEWIDKYLCDGSTSHYEYLPIPSRPYFLIFEEEERETMLQYGSAGEFKLTPLPGQKSLFGLVDHTFLADGLGGQVAKWSSHYKEQNVIAAMDWLERHVLSEVITGRFSWPQYFAIANYKQTNTWPKNVDRLDLNEEEKHTLATLFRHPKGLYVVLDSEPVTADKNVLGHLHELWNLLPSSARTYLEARLQDDELLWSVYGHIPIAIGYPIPNRKEIHWEWVLLQWMEEPSEFWKQPLIWGKTVNSARSRFFGRGALDSTLREEKVLLLGCGAIGSSLAETLVRGGLQHITLADPQAVETGNICRSAYSFIDIHSEKVNSLARLLTSASPFVHVVALRFGLTPAFRHQRQFEENKEALKSYTLIIDCTANDAVAWMLDQMQLDATVINLSISDEAKHLVAVTNTGKEAILPAKRQIFSALGQTETKATFYEGAGCWHPTFRASFADINLLLQQYIADANHRLTKGKGWVTTVLETVKGDFGLRVEKREDVA